MSSSISTASSQRRIGVFISVVSAVLSLLLLNFGEAHAALISKPPTNLGLVGYWSMNEGAGTVAGDASGNNNRGVLTNGPTWNWVTTSTWLLADSATGIVPVNQWFHVAVTWNGVNLNTNVKIYLNGAEVSYTSRSTGTGTFTTTNNLPAAVGGRGDGTNSWPGKIDDVRVYNRALTPAEIKRLYNMGR